MSRPVAARRLLLETEPNPLISSEPNQPGSKNRQRMSHERRVPQPGSGAPDQTAGSSADVVNKKWMRWGNKKRTSPTTAYTRQADVPFCRGPEVVTERAPVQPDLQQVVFYEHCHRRQIYIYFVVGRKKKREKNFISFVFVENGKRTPGAYSLIQVRRANSDFFEKRCPAITATSWFFLKWIQVQCFHALCTTIHSHCLRPEALPAVLLTTEPGTVGNAAPNWNAVLSGTGAGTGTCCILFAKRQQGSKTCPTNAAGRHRSENRTAVSLTRRNRIGIEQI
ncbi:unnamed protein product, partial [Nesidiocoris tenuis]